MITVTIDETKPIGRRILNEIANNPKIGTIEHPRIQRDENGKPLNCISVDQLFTKLDDKLSAHYGVDFKSL